MSTRPLRAAWIYDESAHHQANAQGRNYWPLYTAEILARLGLTAERLAPHALGSPETLAEYSLLIVGAGPADAIPETAASALMEWISDGGTLVGFGCEGLDGLFGVCVEGRIEQPPDPRGELHREFGISAYLAFSDDPLACCIHAPEHAAQPLIIVAPVRKITANDATIVARLLTPAPEQPGRGSAARMTDWAAITRRAFGCGHAIYFAFDLAQTMWAIHQGRPVDADHDGDGWLRTLDARVIEANEVEVPYTDELHLLLQNIVGLQPMPLIHQIPPADSKVANMLIYFGGDDERGTGVQVRASDFMASRGLPYHINAMPDADGIFGMSSDEIAHIRETNGHEISLHYDFMSRFQHPTGFTEPDVQRQMAQFVNVFGGPAVCSVNHCVRWSGWAEPARWMLAAGSRGHNDLAGMPPTCSNPVNTIGFSFGSAFPRHVWDDFTQGNRRLDFVSEPIIAYEVGYQGESTDFETLRRAVDIALRLRLTMEFFYHPVYLSDYPACRLAVDELLRYLDERGARTVFMGNDALVDWWMARDAARVECVEACQSQSRFMAACDYPGGFVVKVCLGEVAGCVCEVDGAAVEATVAREFGRTWAYIPLPPGRHEVTVRLPVGA